MSASHTPERLALIADKDLPPERWAIWSESGRCIATFPRLVDGEQAQQGEDIRRLVACWNACDGSSTEWLEHQTNPDAVEQFGREPFETRYRTALQSGVKAMEQRDELLSALLSIRGLVDQHNRKEISAETLAAWIDLHFNEEGATPRKGSARAAIAKAKK